MTTVAEKFNVDITGLENLLQEVTAYVEVRVGLEDISYEIAREMKELGATISENRNSKVTHVIFREGTLRTSNWAKKHDIPLVELGWLAACTKNKAFLLPRPWQIKYLKEPVDQFGSKKKMQYKKYFKNMNIEEYEKELARSKERRQRNIEKSLNNSKSDISREFDSPETERIMKMSDPVRKRKTPPIVKRYEERIRKYKETGRYSWEVSEDEESGKTETDESNNDDSNKKMEESGGKPEHQTPVIELNESVAENQHVSESPEILESHTQRKYLKSRRLFKEWNNSQESLIEPTNFANTTNDFKSILPKAVQKTLAESQVQSSKRQSWCPDENENKSKKAHDTQDNYSIDFILPKTKRRKTSTTVQPEVRVPELFKTPSPIKCYSQFSRPESPLVKNTSTILTSTPGSNFTTPKKRKSLRTKLLKQSVRKKCFKGSDNEFSKSSLDQSLENKSQPRILVPETEYVNRRKDTKTSENFIFSNTSPVTIFETPLPQNQTQEINNSIDSATLKMMFDTPNASKFLDSIIPNRKKSKTYDHILFIPKDCHDHCLKAIQPSFKKQKKYVAGNLRKSTTEEMKTKLDEIIQSNSTFDKQNNDISTPKSQRKNLRVVHSNIRKSSRLSGQISFGKSQQTQLKEISILVEPLDLQFNGDLKKTKGQSTKPNTSLKIDKINSPEILSGNDLQSLDSRESDIFKNFVESSNPSQITKTDISSDIFKPNNEDTSTAKRYNTRKSARLEIAKPICSLINGSTSTQSTLETESKSNRRKRPWSEIGNQNPVNRKKSKKLFKKLHDSIDDFIINPPLASDKKVHKSSVTSISRELVLVGFTVEEQDNIKSLFNELPNFYHFGEIIRSKEQLIIIQDKPKRTVELIQAFVFGNTFVSVKWIQQSAASKKWLSFTSFIVKDSDMLNVPIIPSVQPSQLLSDYSSMYLSSAVNGLHKYKLRIIIEMSGGKVTDSFRQAGIVINTRKVNAMSVKENWILDSVREGRVLNPNNYLIM